MASQSVEQAAVDKLLQDAEGIYEQGQNYEPYRGELVAPLTGGQQDSMYNLGQSAQLGQQQQAMNQLGADTIYGVGQSQQMAQGVYDTDVGAATDKLYNQYYNQDLLDQQTSSMKQDMYEDYYRGQTQSEWSDVNTGGSGSSRAGVAESMAYDEMNENMLAAQTSLQTGMHEQALSTASQQQQSQMQAQLGASQQMLAAGQTGMNAYQSASDASQQSMMNQMMAGNMQQQQNQAVNMSQYAQWQQAQQAPWDNINQYANLVYGAPQTPVEQDSGSGWSSLFGAGLGAMAMFSDSRLKKDIEPLFKANGVQFVKWTWNESGEDLGLVGESMGVIAQDVLKIIPEAVTLQANGYLAVDYNLVGKYVENV